MTQSSEQAVSDSGPLVRVRMLVAYKGTGFKGFAYQPGFRTVAGELRVALAKMLGDEPLITCAGRTDTGVHAWGQVISFDVADSVIEKYGVTRMAASINKQCGPEIVVRDSAIAESGFDARFSATRRRYRYTILNTPTPSPFLTDTAWWLPMALDIDAMNDAVSAIIGEHDFSSFCRRPAENVHLIRRVTAGTWLRPEPELVRFDIEAMAFCHQMVRSITGTLIEVGKGRWTADDVRRVLDAKDRRAAARPAPPEGLCLWEVVY